MTFDSGSASPKLRFVAIAAAFASLYFVVAALTASLIGDPGIAVVWPASGVYLGVMLVAPRRAWTALACAAGVGSLAAYLHAGSSLEVSVAFAVPSSAEGLLGALLVERIARRRFSFAGLHDLMALVVGGAVVATALVALSAGAVAAQTFDVSFADSWLRWWSADALGVLAIAPAITAAPRTGRRARSRAELRYSVGVVAAVGVAVWLEPSSAATMIGGAIALPVLLWAGWRWGPRAAALGGAGVAVAATHLASQGPDLIAYADSAAGRVHIVQAFLAVLLLGSLAFAAAAGEGRLERAAAAKSRRRLRQVVDSSPDAYLAVDAEGRITDWSAGAEAMFGWPAAEAAGRSLSETIAPGAGPATPTPKARDLALMARHRAGRQFPVTLTMRPGAEGDDDLCHIFVRDLTDSERVGTELDRANAELERRRLARDEARTELEGTAEELGRAGRRIAQLDADLSAQRTELGDANRKLAAAERELGRRGREHEIAVADRDRARRESDERARELRRLQAELAGAVSGRRRTEQELELAAGRLEGVRRELERTQHARGGAERALEEARARSAEELERTRHARGEAERALEEARAHSAEELERTRHAQAQAERALEEARAGSAEERERLERSAEERERLERSLQEAGARLAEAEAERRLLGEHATELISRYDERGICLYASPASSRMLGYEPEELVGRPGAELLHPDDRGELLRARATGSESTFEARLRRRSGDFVWVEVSLHAVRGPEGGRPVEIRTVVRDLSKERDATERRRLAETRFISLFGTVPTASALLASDGRLERANLALCRLTGYSRERLEGAALANIVQREDAALFSSSLRRVASGEVATLRIEQHLVDASGGTIPVELSITPLPTGELVVHFKDLGERIHARDDVRRFTPERTPSSQTAA